MKGRLYKGKQDSKWEMPRARPQALLGYTHGFLDRVIPRSREDARGRAFAAVSTLDLGSIVLPDEAALERTCKELWIDSGRADALVIPERMLYKDGRVRTPL